MKTITCSLLAASVAYVLGRAVGELIGVEKTAANPPIFRPVIKIESEQEAG